LHLRCSAEPVVLVGKQVRLVFYVKAGQQFVERVRVADRNNGVRFAVKYECRWESAGGVGSIGFDETSREIDESTDAAAGCWIGRRRKFSRETKREECAERDADKRNAAGINARTCCDKGECGVECRKPLRDVDAVGDGSEVRADGVGAIEVVRCVKRDPHGVEGRREAVEPVADVATGTMHHDDRRVGRGCFGLVHVDADVTVAGAEGALHGDWMREEAGIVQSRDRTFFLWVWSSAATFMGVFRNENATAPLRWGP